MKILVAAKQVASQQTQYPTPAGISTSMQKWISIFHQNVYCSISIDMIFYSSCYVLWRRQIYIMYILVRIEAKGKTRYGRYCLSISLQNNSLHAASCYLVISQLNILLGLAVPFLCHRHQIIEKKKVATGQLRSSFPTFFFSLLAYIKITEP